MDGSTARRDFLRTEISAANAFITDKATLKDKYTAMKECAFSFYRATCHLFYSDLASGLIAVPSDWKAQPETEIWVHGDFHTRNIGFFDDDRGEVIFDLNDADESYLGKFYYDLLRYATSLFLLGVEVTFSLSTDDKRDMIRYFVEKYKETLAEVVENSGEKRARLTARFMKKGFMLDKLQEIEHKRNLGWLLSHWTLVEAGQRRFNENHTELNPISEVERSGLLQSWSVYLEDIEKYSRQQAPDYFKIKDIARRVNSGLGSRGVNRFYFLLEGPSALLEDDIILDVKEQRLPALFHDGAHSTEEYNSRFPNHATRSKVATLAQGIRVDKHLGVLPVGETSYRVSRVSPWKAGFDPQDFKSAAELQDFVKYSARALAFAHARADQDFAPEYVPYNFEKSALRALKQLKNFKEILPNLAQAYFHQVQADYSLFSVMVDTGEL